MSKNINKLVFNFLPPTNNKVKSSRHQRTNSPRTLTSSRSEDGDWTESGLGLMDSTERNIIRWAAQFKKAKMNWKLCFLWCTTLDIMCSRTANNIHRIQSTMQQQVNTTLNERTNGLSTFCRNNIYTILSD